MLDLSENIRKPIVAVASFTPNFCIYNTGGLRNMERVGRYARPLRPTRGLGGPLTPALKSTSWLTSLDPPLWYAWVRHRALKWDTVTILASFTSTYGFYQEVAYAWVLHLYLECGMTLRKSRVKVLTNQSHTCTQWNALFLEQGRKIFWAIKRTDILCTSFVNNFNCCITFCLVQSKSSANIQITSKPTAAIIHMLSNGRTHLVLDTFPRSLNVISLRMKSLFLSFVAWFGNWLFCLSTIVQYSLLNVNVKVASTPMCWCCNLDFRTSSIAMRSHDRSGYGQR